MLMISVYKAERADILQLGTQRLRKNDLHNVCINDLDEINKWERTRKDETNELILNRY